MFYRFWFIFRIYTIFFCYSLKSSRSPYIYDPCFQIENDELLEDPRWKDVKDLYDNLYDASDINQFLALSPAQFKKALAEVPKGLKTAIKIEVGSGNTSLTQASQTSGGTNSFGFGLGGNTYNGGAGGGGWYGGGACSDYSDSTNYQGYNGGGSGYVYTSATAANYPSGNYVNSSYYLTNAQTIAGNQSFKSPDGTNETGHTGNGFCRITRKSGKIFVKQNGSWIKV